MTGRYAVVANVHSRKIRKDSGLLLSLRETFRDHGPFLALNHPSELPATLKEIRQLRPDVLFICGGDGTLRQTLGELIRTYGDAPLPKIAILKTGTMNTVAGSLGVRLPALPQLRAILSRAFPLPSVRLHLLEIDGTYGFIFAVGGFSNFIAQYAAVADPSPSRAIRMLTHATLSSIFRTPYARALFPTFRARLGKNGAPFSDPCPVTTVGASAIRHIGFGFKPFAHAEGPEGEFGALILRASPAALVPHLFAIRRGRPIRSRTIQQFSAASLRIELDSPLSPMVDGDLLPPRKEFALRRGPALDFVTG
jgi:diacylglycerol kinase (ATP)